MQVCLKTVILSIASMTLGLAAIILLLEVMLRSLPVSSGLMTQPVTTASPLFHFLPNRDLWHSQGWRFAYANRIHVNNAGFVNPVDYDSSVSTPLLAVIGDSYVEALIVPQQETLHARLARRTDGRGRVYSFAASGAPLSQYLIWAEHASREYGAGGGVFVVVGNDFDESLASVKRGPGFHHFAERGGRLELELVEYQPNRRRELIYASALGRYLVFNLKALDVLTAFWATLADRAARCTVHAEFVGNTSAESSTERLSKSRRAVDTFLAELPRRTGWKPARVLLLVDGVRRYAGDGTLGNAPGSYFSQMRAYLIKQAAKRGFGVVDMHPIFAMRHAADRSRFEYADDAHWNSLAHELAAEAIVKTRLYWELFSQ